MPTTPNPTSGYLLLVPRADARVLPLTVEEGIRVIISGGSILEPDQVLGFAELAAGTDAAGALPAGEGEGER